MLYQIKIIIIVELRHGSLSCLKIFFLDKVCFVGDEAEIKTVKKTMIEDTALVHFVEKKKQKLDEYISIFVVLR